MRTKTLLLSAALGLGTGAVAMAQVYSINAVGYVNVTMKPGFNMVANPLNNQTDNKITTLVPAPVDGATVYKYGASGYSDANVFIEGLGWTDESMTLAPGEGCWFFNADTKDFAVTFVGEVPQGHLVNSLRAGFTLASSIVPQAGLLTTDLKFPVVDGDTIYTYAPATGYSVFNFIEGLGYDPAEPTVAVAQGFWSLKAAAVDWARDFSVNTP